MDGDEWKDQSHCPDSAREYAEYMTRIFKVFVEELEKGDFSRAEAVQIAIAVIPSGFSGTQKS